MGRWSYLDTDEERLPHGIKRIGYDADDREYTFFDTSDGSIWVGGYNGPTKCISRPDQAASSSDDSKDEPAYNNIPTEEVGKSDPQPSNNSPNTKALLNSFVAVGRLARIIVARRGPGADRRLIREERRRERRAREQTKEERLRDEQGLGEKEFEGEEFV
ncbi:hypothetical protein F5Y00DRAFT_233082 [Daldinia vernicosa]|uniref:uncharacterized protein n=1 Tax=Daldinia vernicosa TaxID=114800 RepID=UPI0020088698|nr:uncharacterized protein F5Y00DRAFT_233082 [Daldinia vernicosa]KAI0850318.1 hypothetical protein F5Y00DRAFT_233082 [Daldinia vernicosa]